MPNLQQQDTRSRAAPIGESPAHEAIRIYGIRHHGPGSARSLLNALEAQQPDYILIEGPPDANALLPHVSHSNMLPPVALLVYNPKQLQQASFFPFAEFSPEWQAICFALRQDVPVQFMDLPMSSVFGLQPAAQEADLTTLFPAEVSVEATSVRQDPFGEIAALAGYTDPERWWEAMFERGPALDPFPVVLELMEALRDSKTQAESSETLLREAYMRQTIRAAHQAGAKNMAVICGAWHTPALSSWKKIKASADAALLKGLKKVRTEATWIPWSFDRLSVRSGYAAGVLAPAWYQVLWENPPSATAGISPTAAAVWLSAAARLLREHDVETSSAHIIEAIRLAETMAALRSTEQPGIEELRQAAVSVMGLQTEKPLELVDSLLVVGDVLGQVPDVLPMPPLKVDFEAQAKSCRLERSTVEKRLELDLRKESDLRKSVLLHRVSLMGIAWGTPVEVGASRQGRFHEHWLLKWLPDYEIRFIEAGTWGNTVEAAAARLASVRIGEADSLPSLTALLEQLIQADLPAVLHLLLHKLKQTSALSADALRLADALPPLVNALRYGQARRVDVRLMQQVVEQIIPRLCLHLPAACALLDEEAATEVMKKMLALNRAFGILQSAEYTALWQGALQAVQDSGHSAPLLSGLSTRLLFDQQQLSVEKAGRIMQYHLSAGQVAGMAAAWLAGFLHGSGLLLLHHPGLWGMLDAWVGGLDDGAFQESLPLLRRTFSRFAAPERGKMLDLARHNTSNTTAAADTADDEWDVERAEAVLRVVRGWI